MEDKHLKILEDLGFDIKDKTYYSVIEELIEQHIKTMMEIENGNTNLIKEGLKRLMKPTN